MLIWLNFARPPLGQLDDENAQWLSIISARPLWGVTVGSCATGAREPGQGRKAAALSDACRVPQIAWPSLPKAGVHRWGARCDRRKIGWLRTSDIAAIPAVEHEDSGHYRAEMHEKPVAIISNAKHYVGPALAVTMASAGYDLVLGEPSPETIEAVTAAGADSWVVDGALDLSVPASAPRLVDMAMDAYARVDSAAFFSGEIVLGKFRDATDADFEKVVSGNLEAVFRSLRAFVHPMVEAGSGQILAITSASGIKVTPMASLYSSTRAAANMLVRNVAAEVAGSGVQVNAVGTNFMDFPMFRAAMGADDPEILAKIEKNVPMGRLGTMTEFAQFCRVFLDGTARFQTGQVVGFDGGWSAQ